MTHKFLYAEAINNMLKFQWSIFLWKEAFSIFE